MVQFFRRDFAEEVDTLTKRMEELRQALLKKSSEITATNKEWADKFTIAANDIHTVVDNYKRAIFNSTTESQKKKLTADFKTVVDCLNTMSQNPEAPSLAELIKRRETSNKMLYSKEVLSRIGDALAAMFWIGTFLISIATLTVFISTIAADPIGGVALSMVSFGLLSYSFNKIFNNANAVFEPKYFYENYRQINGDDISLLSNLKDAYTPPVEPSSLTV